MRVRRCGATAVLIEVSDPIGWWQAIRGRGLPGVVDVVPGDRTVLVSTRAAADLAGVRRALPALAPREAAEGTVSAAAPLTLEVIYDGPDLDRVARAWETTCEEVVRRHASVTWTVAFCGFAPGFGYLRTNDPGWRSVPRRETPRTRVPAGSVALAGDYAGVYPRESPGGWQLIGTTRARLFDPGAAEPAALLPGRAVRFVEAT